MFVMKGLLHAVRLYSTGLARSVVDSDASALVLDGAESINNPLPFSLRTCFVKL